MSITEGSFQRHLAVASADDPVGSIAPEGPPASGDRLRAVPKPNEAQTSSAATTSTRPTGRKASRSVLFPTTLTDHQIALRIREEGPASVVASALEETPIAAAASPQSPEGFEADSSLVGKSPPPADGPALMLSGTSSVELELRQTGAPETLGAGTEESTGAKPATVAARLDQWAGIADRSIDRSIPSRPVPGTVKLPAEVGIQPPMGGVLKENVDGVWSAPVTGTSVADSRFPLRVARSSDRSVEVGGQPRRIGPIAEAAIGAGTSDVIHQTIPWALRQAAVQAVSVSAKTGTDTLTPPPDQAVRLGESLRAQVLDRIPTLGIPTGDPVFRAEPFLAPDRANNPPDGPFVAANIAANIAAGTSFVIDETVPRALRQAADRAVSVSAKIGTDTLTPPPSQAVRLGEPQRGQVLAEVPSPGTRIGDPVFRSDPLATARFDPLEGPFGSAIREQAEPFLAPDRANNPPDGPFVEAAIAAGTSVAIDETVPRGVRQAAVRAVSVSAKTGTDTLTPPTDQAVRLGEPQRAQVLDGAPSPGTPAGDPGLRAVPVATTRFDPLEGLLGSAISEHAEPFLHTDGANNPSDGSIALEADVPGPWVSREGAVPKRSTVPDPRSSSPSGRFPMNAPETNDPRTRGGLDRDAGGGAHDPRGTVFQPASDLGVSTGDGLRPDPSFRSDSPDPVPAHAGVAHTKPEGLLSPGTNPHLATGDLTADPRSADATPVHQPIVRAPVPAEQVRRVDLDASGARGVELRIEEMGERLIVRTLDPLGVLEARDSQWTEMQQRLEASGIVLMPVETSSNASTSKGDDRPAAHGSRHDDCYDASMDLSGRDGSAPRSSGGDGRMASSPAHDAAWRETSEDGGGALSNPEPRGWWA